MHELVDAASRSLGSALSQPVQLVYPAWRVTAPTDGGPA